MSKSDPLEYYVNQLRQKGLRKTTQKVAVLRTMLELGCPAPIEVIHQKIKKITCDLTTIYRSMLQLEEVGLVQKSIFKGQAAHYSLAPMGRHTHHIQCTSCHSLTEMDTCFVEKQTKLIESLGFKEVKHRLEFFGLCPDCS